MPHILYLTLTPDVYYDLTKDKTENITLFEWDKESVL